MTKSLRRDVERLGKPIGRPKKYDSPIVLENAITTYFETCNDKPIIGGFASSLGLTHQQLLEWMKNETNVKLSSLLKLAKQQITDTIEARLVYGTTSPIGSLFWLKNVGSGLWKDKQEVETTGKSELSINMVDFSTKKLLDAKQKQYEESNEVIEVDSSESE